MSKVTKLILYMAIITFLTACNANKDEFKINKSDEVDNRGLITPYSNDKEPTDLKDRNDVDRDMDRDFDLDRNDWNDEVIFGNQRTH